MIFDLRAGLEAGLFTGETARAAEAAAGPTLNPLMALGSAPRIALRKRLSALLSADNPERAKIEGLAARLLHHAADCTMHLPATIGSFTDFFAGIHHARNGGMRRDPNNPLSPNYKYVPVAYHSRATSVRPSGVPIRRPNGQRKLPNEDAPSYGPCRKLDYELELAVWVGPGNVLGEPIPIARGRGPFVRSRPVQRLVGARHPAMGVAAVGTLPRQELWLAPSRRGSSPPEALAPFRVAQPPRARPAIRARCRICGMTLISARGAFDIALEALLLTEGLRAKGLPPHHMSASNTTDLYWTVAQMIAHHASNGCNLAPGDLFGSGTISGSTAEGYGSLMELSNDGTRTITLASGETRTFVENGDEVIFRAHCRKAGCAPIGFGECRARII